MEGEIAEVAAVIVRIGTVMIEFHLMVMARKRSVSAQAVRLRARFTFGYQKLNQTKNLYKKKQLTSEGKISAVRVVQRSGWAQRSACHEIFPSAPTANCRFNF